MPTTAGPGCLERLGEQMARERLLHEAGQQRLHERTEKLIQKTSFTQSVVGRKLLTTGLKATADMMQDKWKCITSKPGVDHAELMEALDGLDKGVCALIGLKISLDHLIKDRLIKYTDVALAVGNAIQAECRMSWYYNAKPELYMRVQKNRFHKSSGAHHKVASMTDSFIEAGVRWKPWTRRNMLRVGNWVLGCIGEATGWLKVGTIQHTPSRKLTVLAISPILSRILHSVWEKADALAYLRRPMLSEPIDWHWNEATGGYEGGYLLPEIHWEKMIRTECQEQAHPGPVALEAINRLQKVRFRINPNVLATACWARDRRIGQIGSGSSGACFFYGSPKEMLGRFQGEEDDVDGLKKWKKMKAHIYDYNAQLDRDNVRTSEVMHVAESLRDEVFYIPWSFDYRGRLYPIPPVLSPQGIDFERAFFYFAEEGPVNRDWLAFQVATSYGLDKATMQERIQWVLDHEAMITAIAEDPCRTLSLWEGAEEPWQFMAACCEYHACCIECTKQTSGLPVGIDATCSGLQHLAALTMDATAAALVNVTPAETIADGYRTVAEVARPFLPERVREWITRKVTKRTVMTTPYGVSRHSARGYIRAQLREDGRDLTEEGLLTRITSAIYDQAMPQVFAGPVAVMKWIQKSAESAIEDGGVIRWTSPSGFEVIQSFFVPLIERVATMLLGAVRIRANIVTGYTDEVDKPHHKSAAAPNLVHSCDAALLHFLFSEWDHPIYGVHDCVAGRSCDMSELSRMVRVHFCEMYRGRDVLADWARDVGVEPNPDLIVGDLDIEQVLDSQYFFC